MKTSLKSEEYYNKRTKNNPCLYLNNQEEIKLAFDEGIRTFAGYVLNYINHAKVSEKQALEFLRKQCEAACEKL